jgi:S-adenosylmethionine:tRNA ribosyltransferase-isomerase
MKFATNYLRGDSKKVTYFDDGKPKTGRTDDLLNCFRPGDLIVVNDSATVPMSVMATDFSGRQLELRLLKAGSDSTTFRAIAYEGESWRVPTEKRKIVHPESCGTSLFVGTNEFKIERFDGVVFQLIAADKKKSVLKTLYQTGRMIQYSYMERETPVWAAQTIFSSRPWSSESPSASFVFNWNLIFALVSKGVRFARVTHGAGFSSIGDFKLDSVLPLPEISFVPQETLRLISETRERGSRVIAIGTSVVRAVEAAALFRLTPNHPFENSLHISPEHPIGLFDGIVTGLHQKGESHFELLTAFVSAREIEELMQKADNSGCLTHEFGDFMFLEKGG